MSEQVGPGGKARTIRNADGLVTAIEFHDGDHVYIEMYATPMRFDDVTEWANFMGKRVPMMRKQTERNQP